MTPDMPRARLPYLRHEKNRHGTWCWYFRMGDERRVRLRAPYGSKQFLAEYEAALRGKPIKDSGANGGTVAWLVARYRESARYANLKASTRMSRDRILKGLVKSAGHNQFVNIKRRHIERAMDERANTPHAANNFLIVVRQMFEWAVANAHIGDNPCTGVAAIDAKAVGFHAWTVAEVEQYRQHHPIGSKPRLALEMLLLLGLRVSDVILAGRQHVKDGVLSMQTTKTGAWVHLPVLPRLRSVIDATETGDMAFLTTSTGLPFSSAGSFGNWFKERCRDAGLPHCSAHGLRKAGATMAADDGASERELMAMYGWGRASTAEVYTKTADRKRLARAAAERIANANPPHHLESAAEKSKN